MSQLQTQANRGFGLLTGRPTATNINGVDSGLNSTPSSGSSILDTLKKKMNQLKEELEIFNSSYLMFPVDSSIFSSF